MSKQHDIVDSTSNDSFPASDPPAWTPVTGAGNPHTLNKVFTVGNRKVIHVENGRGEELRQHLASHGIDALVSTGAETPFERVEVETDADTEVLQAILDEWES